MPGSVAPDPQRDPYVASTVHQQGDPLREPLGAFSETSSLDPMERIAIEGRMLRDAKARLKDPGTSRRDRWKARAVLATVFGPILGWFLFAVVLELVRTFG